MDPRKKYFKCGVCKNPGFTVDRSLHEHMKACINRKEFIENHSLSWTKYTFMAFVCGLIENLPAFIATKSYFKDYFIRRQIINIYDIIYSIKVGESIVNFAALDRFQLQVIEELNFKMDDNKARLIPGINKEDLMKINRDFYAFNVFNVEDTILFNSNKNINNYNSL